MTPKLILYTPTQIILLKNKIYRCAYAQDKPEQQKRKIHLQSLIFFGKYWFFRTPIFVLDRHKLLSSFKRWGQSKKRGLVGEGVDEDDEQ